ncbi:50S ribosomal protein L10, partial [Staphylococcus saprophyticus]|uniref:50S ribosomal protein L10 n=1 Tax=Staphylococcus saprophyticus TaxID=29385 RepID=UPI0037047667
MSPIIHPKKQQLHIIPQQLKNSLSTLILHYPPLTLAELTQLPSQLRQPAVQYKVLKN